MIRMKAISPVPFRADAIYKRLVGAAERSADFAEKEFAKTYRTWDHKPTFKKKVKASRGSIGWEVWTADQIYSWVSGGTKGPYKIPKDKPGLLVFPSGYKAKTTPNLVFSKQGGSFGSTVFFYGQVTHPGIDPRNFDEAVARFVKPWWVKWNADAIKVGARESGHSI